MSQVNGSVTIPSGSAVSNALGDSFLKFLRSIAIYAPAILDAANTYNVQVCAVLEPADGDWRDLTDLGGTNVVLTAGEVIIIESAGTFRGLRIKDVTGNVAADRVFQVVGQEM